MGKDFPKDFEHTDIDLGEDLLNTKTLNHPSVSEEETVALPTPEEVLLNAKILLGENLLDQAKQSLRTALKHHPDHLGLREKLSEIFQIEIKNLLEDREQRRKKPEPSHVPSEDCETLREFIGKDFDKEQNPLTEEQQKESFADVERFISTSSPRDCLDFGIAFFEMGLYPLAAVLYQHSAQEPALEQSSLELRARCFYEMSKPFDAIMELQPILNDSSIEPEKKCEASYWVARSYEVLGNHSEALLWYRITDELNPDYRDCKERAYLCAKKSSSSSH